MVQTNEQYEFLHQALCMYEKELSEKVPSGEWGREPQLPSVYPECIAIMAQRIWWHGLDHRTSVIADYPIGVGIEGGLVFASYQDRTAS